MSIKATHLCTYLVIYSFLPIAKWTLPENHGADLKELCDLFPLCVTPQGFLHVAHRISTNGLKPHLSLISTSLVSYNAILNNLCLLAIISLCYLLWGTDLWWFLSCRMWQNHGMLLRWLYDATVRLIFKTFFSATLGGSSCPIVTNSGGSVTRNVEPRVGLQKQAQEITNNRKPIPL